MNFLSKVPGFRSGKKLNKRIASIYYVFQLFSLVAVFGQIDLMCIALSTLAYPFIVFGFIDVIKNKQKIKSRYFVNKVVVPFIAMFVLTSVSLLIPTSDLDMSSPYEEIKTNNDVVYDKYGRLLDEDGEVIKE